MLKQHQDISYNEGTHRTSDSYKMEQITEQAAARNHESLTGQGQLQQEALSQA